MNGTAHLLLGEDERADRDLRRVAAAGLRRSPRATRSRSASARCSRPGTTTSGRGAGARSAAPDRGRRARRLCDRALDLAATARALLRHGRWDEARRQLTITQRLAPSLTHAIPWLSVQVRLELARAYVTLRDADGASALLDEAREILRAAAGARRARRAGRRARGRDRGDAARRPAADSGLTRAELRLLPLLSTHLSFREIGERLFVSRNTIKTQAISVYRKLGVSSRSDAIARAGELGLVEPAVGSAAAGSAPATSSPRRLLATPRPGAARIPSGAACRRSSPRAARARRRR